MNARAIVLASRNAGKLAEMQALLDPLDMQVRLVREFTDEDAAETAPSFVENALLKARLASRVSGLPAIADDSGLEVAALHGAPGVNSARYAGAHGDDDANNRKLLQALAGRPESGRDARFVCALAFLRHADDPVPVIALGLWPGRILESPRGANGFGYDPLFWVPDQGCSSAELDPGVKNRISHRARAVAALIAQLRETDQ